MIGPLTVFAQSAIDPAFNPGLLITDTAFSDKGTFGSAEGIQQFFEQRGSVLARTDQSFLLKLKEPDYATKEALEDPNPQLGRLRSAAELIYDATQKHGLNPQVILVLLQKEQSLVDGNFTSDDRLQRALDRALGFGCPDNGGCGDIFLSFYRQLFGSFDSQGSRWLGAAASLMRSFETAGGRGPRVDSANQVFGSPTVRTSQVGDTIVLDNTTGGYSGVQPTQSVTIGNKATAALYRYTPHVFNGNYNFWRFYSKWFKYPNGTVIQLSGEAVRYVIDNGTKRLFSDFVAVQRKLKTDTVVTLSQSEFSEYLTEKPLPPLEDTLLKGEADATVFVVKVNKKRPISGAVFSQRGLSFAKVVSLPQAEVDGYELGAHLPPKDGTLIIAESDPTVYLIENGVKRPITGDVFTARKFSFKNLMRLTDPELASLPTGDFVRPPDSTALQLKGDTGIYWFKDGQKRFVSAFVYKQRGVNAFPHIIIGSEEFEQVPTATPFPPRDGTVIKGDVSTAIYRIENGVKRMFTAASYAVARHPVATVLPQAEVDSFAEGAVIE
ncbi:MAG: hypothetical protein HYW51_01750 [Candidatus Doudnabacteria bacterium]|nr:hypothetical protein [Candidatus Doudnabacteria bacterium]